MDKAGIAVAEYWTALPPKAEFEQKIRDIYYKTQERLERRKLLADVGGKRTVNFFIESEKDDEG